MRGILLAVLFIITELCVGQKPDIYKYPQILEHKVNLFIDTFERKIYDIRSIDSSIKFGNGVALVRDSVCHDTAYWTFFFLQVFKQEETYLYKRLVGKKFPNLNYHNLKGNHVSNLNYKGKIILINFWSTTCGPCIAEIPSLNKLVDYLKGGPFAFVALTKDHWDEVAKFLIHHPFKYDVFSDVGKLNDEIGVTDYPTNIVIDKSGKVYAIMEGVNFDPIKHKLLMREEIDSVLRNLAK